MMAGGQDFATLSMHAGHQSEQSLNRDVIQPISLSVVFEKPAPSTLGPFCYSRFGNPNRLALETTLAALEKSKYALTFGSGMAPVFAVFHALLKSGDHIVAGLDCYSETSAMIRSYEKFGVSHTFVESSVPSDWAKGVKVNATRNLVWLESPTNPKLMVLDLQAVAQAVRRVTGDVVLVADNTIMTSFLQRPLQLGMDVAVYSLTKYYNGHNDAVMGAVLTDEEAIFESVKKVQSGMGSVPSPFDCYLVSRGIKTMAVRMRMHCENALAIAHFLQTQPKVRGVMYPGLKDHPDHEVAVKQSPNGFSGLVSFYVVSQDEHPAVKLLSCLKIFRCTGSFGGVESFTDLPLYSTARAHTPDTLAKLGIDETLVRLAVGIESLADLIQDLEQGFQCLA